MDGSDARATTQQRMDAIKLAKASKWDELKALVDAEPLTAQQMDSYGMLPLHWACTEPHSISESVLMALLKAYPQGARATNTAEMVPLQIAIKAQAKIEWLQALLASFPDAVLKKVPSGENAVQLAKKANLPARSIKLLEEMYHHVCQKAGYATDQLDFDDSAHDAMYVPADKISMSGLRPMEPSAAEGLQRYISESRSSGGSKGANAVRRSSKSRAFSENDFSAMGSESFRATAESSFLRQVSGSSNNSGGGTGSYSVAKPLPYQTSTKLSSRTIVSLPPRWTNAPNCHICSTKFGPFRKRHHCRNCGQSICSDHSAREKLRLPHYGLNDRHRVCTVCYETLKNADKQLMQPSQTRVVPPVGAPVRRSDDGANRATQAGGYSLERHVSAPAPVRHTPDNNFRGIHQQVASLQKQVSQLMEEKEIAESQLRLQADILNEALSVDPERMTNAIGRRDRLNTYPAKLPSNGSFTTGHGEEMHLGAAPAPYGAREVDIDAPTPGPKRLLLPAPPTSNTSAEDSAFEQLKEEFGGLSFVESTYDLDSDLEDRPTEAFDDLDDDADITVNDDEEDESALPEVEVLVNLGVAMLEKGSSSAAVQAFSRAVEICPDDPSLYSYLGKAYYEDENLDDAVLAIEKSLELEPSAANSTLLGKILFEKGDHERAIEAYQKSLDIQKARD
ncbi:TPA: hypothetical protein N0F65_000125 [Lagenidium giganteum]|uniref:FYVE-type domain-containing protein n=1 Tax=Lagenidium giganteum TaxID=4803 RepID=A0AAV2YXU0_9STRA|nr:TPA: hypothetical protein N0F65_000125 [Lagenidium giganteum]